MEIDLANLPDDAGALKALVQQLLGTVKTQGLKIAQLEARLAKLRRMQFGQSSEKLSREIEQLELELDTLHEDQAREAAERPAVVQKLIEKPYRKPLPEHLPREEEVHEPACACPNCGGALRRLGEDVTEVLDYVPASFKVIRHVRPKCVFRGSRAAISRDRGHAFHAIVGSRFAVACGSGRGLHRVSPDRLGQELS
jgi:hypothetical protein